MFNNISSQRLLAKMFTALTLFFFALPGAHAATAAVPECNHDVAPLDKGRHARDLAGNNVVSEGDISVGTVITMRFKAANGDLVSATCRTAKPRRAALTKNGYLYDTLCGNEIVAGFSLPRPKPVTPALPASAPAPAASAPCVDCSRETVIVHTTVIRDRVVRECPDGRRLEPEQQCSDVVVPPLRIKQERPVCTTCDTSPLPPKGANCNYSGTYYECRGVPPAEYSCPCVLKPSGRFPGVYFPGMHGQSCDNARRIYAERNNLRINWMR